MWDDVFESFQTACVSGDLQKTQQIFTENSGKLHQELHYVLRILVCAFNKRHFDIIDWMLTQDIGRQLFIYVCTCGNLDFAKWLFNRIKLSQIDINSTFYSVCRTSNLNVIQWLAPMYKCESNDGLIRACETGYLNVVTWILHNMKLNQLDINDAFLVACIYGHLEIAQLLYPLSDDVNFAFINACENGKLNIAKWLLSMDPKLIIERIDHSNDIYENVVFLEKSCVLCSVCDNGHLDMAKWLFETFQLYCTNAFTCSYRDLDIIKWMLSICSEIDIYAKNNLLIKRACFYNGIDTVKWLVENYYQSYPYIKFDNYSEYAFEIKDILIEYNLIDPSTLTEPDLDYYLQKTNGVVPPDFVNQYNNPVKIRGQHTKPALRE
jgi:hypothetical protein